MHNGGHRCYGDIEESEGNTELVREKEDSSGDSSEENRAADMILLDTDALIEILEKK